MATDFQSPRYKYPLEFLSVNDWNTLINDLYFVRDKGTVRFLQHYNNGNLQNINTVYAKTLNVWNLIVNGYEALYNLKPVLAYTFGDVFKKLSLYPKIVSQIPQLQKLVAPELYAPSLFKVKYQLSLVHKYQTETINALARFLISHVTEFMPPNLVAGGMTTVSGSQNLKSLLMSTFGFSEFPVWDEITIQNIGNNPLTINNAIKVNNGGCIKITVSDPSEIILSSSSPTLISALLSFYSTKYIPPPTPSIPLYSITITNNQSDPTPSNFQQLLSLNLQGIVSSPSQLLNLKFCSDQSCSSQLYAWIEYYSSDLSTVYIWVLLPNGVPANSSVTIYMQLASSSQYPYTGINTFYDTADDNGADVFDAYMNFMGTSPIPSNYQTYTDISGFPQFSPIYEGYPGYMYTFASETNSYDDIYISAPKSQRLPEIFEGMAWYDGTADSQGIMFLGDLSSGWCEDTSYGDTYYLCNSWEVAWDPDYSDAYVSNGSSGGSTYSESLFTSSSYNFYQAIATDSEIIFNGATPSSPNTPYAQLDIQNVFTYSGSICMCGDVVGTIESSSSNTHSGAWYYLRARAYPPNGVMPSNSQPTPV
ncbi:hypothetical protein ARV1_gp27 [Acidianus rod-shaped virus 1]|uniref:DUF2341 domain-containing protein n=1 Tax=Acidianus rod-shaped virus 1 TaxID=309181 RepID=Q50I44_9VIRU|nr:hypothetical protein ARV1_gp27 [Acidianus rod-shaped virus 1]CAI44182.1 hypothetical protein [Acidianus rod-shaped virus 1]